jgi:hypothetical protein
MKKVDKEEKVIKKNVFGFKEGSNKALISNMFLENGITLQNAAKTVAKKLDKDEIKANSLVLGMVKRLLKKGHKIEVLITTPKKNDQIKKDKPPLKLPPKKDSVKETKSESGEENPQKQTVTA